MKARTDIFVGPTETSDKIVSHKKAQKAHKEKPVDDLKSPFAGFLLCALCAFLWLNF